MEVDLVIKNGWVVTPEETVRGGVAISDGKFVAIGTDQSLPDAKEVIDANGRHILPGIIDAHVHFRDPGVTHKEDFATGSTAAVCGGVTTIVDMPNQIPPTENAEQVEVKKRIAESKSMCDFAVLGVVHQTNADDIIPMAKAGAIGYKIFFGETIGNLPFPDDGMCIEVFSNITKSGVPLCVHAENRQIQHYWTNKLKSEGKNDPIYWESSRPYLCEAESVAHLIFLAENFGTKLHIVHTSSKQAAQMVKDAKARGLRVTAETGPHYLLREGDELVGIEGVHANLRAGDAIHGLEAGEGDARSVGRPARSERNGTQVGELMLVGAVVIHGPDFLGACAGTDEGDLRACNAGDATAELGDDFVGELVSEFANLRVPR